MTLPPSRLSDDPAAPDLARALSEAQRDVLSAAAVARVRASLVAAGVVAGGAAPGRGHPAASGGPGAPAATLVRGATRFGIGLAAIGLVGLAGLAGLARVASTRPATREPGVAAIETSATAASPRVEPGSAPSPAGSAVAPAPEAPPPSVPTALALETARARPSAPATMAGAPSLQEGALLLEARRALVADPARALALVRAHEIEFPASQLRPERARIAAEARQRLGK